MLQWSMYYLSFTPLWISIIFIEVMSLIHVTDSLWTEKIALIAIPVFFFAALIVMVRGLRTTKIGSQRYRIKEAREEKLITAEFLATFIIPLFTFDFTTWEGMGLFGFFFLVFGWLCVRHNYFCTNIMLDVLRYRIYEFKLVDSQNIEIERKIISKRDLRLCTEIIYVRGINNDYSVDCFEKRIFNDI